MANNNEAAAVAKSSATTMLKGTQRWVLQSVRFRMPLSLTRPNGLQGNGRVIGTKMRHRTIGEQPACRRTREALFFEFFWRSRDGFR